MASKVADAPPVVEESAEPRPTPAAGRAAILAPVLAALAALALHQFTPNGQDLPETWLSGISVWLHPYPVLLIVLLAFSLAAAIAAFVAPGVQSWAAERAPLLAGAIGVLALWDLVTQKLNWMVLPFFPGPNLVFASMFEDRGDLLLHTLYSLRLLITGYSLGVLAGIGTGTLIGWFSHIRYWGMPALKLIGPLPATALVPLAMKFFPGGFLAPTVLIGFAVWFPVTMLTFSGIANVRISHLDVARTLGARPWFLIMHVALPSALPHAFIGLFMGLSASFLTLIVAETVGVPNGLGWYINNQRGSMTFANAYAALFIMMIFFSTLMTLLFRVRDRVLTWQKGVIKW